MPIGWQKQPKSTETSMVSNNSAFSKEEELPNMGQVEQFVPEQPIRTLEELVIPITVRTRIEAALNRIQFHDILYNQWNLRKIDPHRTGTAINLFGPPGTGKTFCAEAIAKHLMKKIIQVNYAEIESKYVGETPKNITAAFQKASEADAVLFFDEADSILGKRLTNVTFKFLNKEGQIHVSPRDVFHHFREKAGFMTTPMEIV